MLGGESGQPGMGSAGNDFFSKCLLNGSRERLAQGRIGGHIIDLIIARMQRAHQAVPDGGPQSVIFDEVLVVHVMRHGGVDVFSHPIPVQAFGQDLEPEVTIYIIADLEKHVRHNGCVMHRQGEGDHCYDQRLQNGFKGMKGIGCPGRWIGGFMMDEVYVLENFGMMHEAMRPVEIGIMEEEHPDKSEEVIGLAVLMDVIVEVGVRFQDGEGDHAHGGKDAHRDGGIKNIPLIVFEPGKSRLYLTG